MVTDDTHGYDDDDNDNDDEDDENKDDDECHDVTMSFTLCT